MRTLQVNGHLVIGESGALRVTKRKPALAHDEIAVALTVKVPRELFSRVPLSMVVEVPGGEAEPVPVELGEVVTAEPGLVADIADAD